MSLKATIDDRILGLLEERRDIHDQDGRVVEQLAAELEVDETRVYVALRKLAANDRIYIRADGATVYAVRLMRNAPKSAGSVSLIDMRPRTPASTNGQGSLGDPILSALKRLGGVVHSPQGKASALLLEEVRGDRATARLTYASFMAKVATLEKAGKIERTACGSSRNAGYVRIALAGPSALENPASGFRPSIEPEKPEVPRKEPASGGATPAGDGAREQVPDVPRPDPVAAPRDDREVGADRRDADGGREPRGEPDDADLPPRDDVGRGPAPAPEPLRQLSGLEGLEEARRELADVLDAAAFLRGIPPRELAMHLFRELAVSFCADPHVRAIVTVRRRFRDKRMGAER